MTKGQFVRGMIPGAVWALVWLCFGLLVSTAHAADCASVLEQVTVIARQIADPDLRQAVALDLAQARTDMLEDDQEECAMWLFRAARKMGMR
jgi:hypothetical protein